MASGFVKGTLILTIAGFVVKAIGSINWILLSRILGGEGIGIYQMAFPIYLLLLQISSAGVPIAISILTAERLALHDFGGAKRVFNISFTMLTITGFIASLAMYFGADWLISSGLIAESRAYYSIIALAPAVFFVTWISCFRGYIQGYEMMTPTAVSQIVEQLLRVISESMRDSRHDACSKGRCNNSSQVDERHCHTCKITEQFCYFIHREISV